VRDVDTADGVSVGGRFGEFREADLAAGACLVRDDEVLTKFFLPVFVDILAWTSLEPPAVKAIIMFIGLVGYLASLLASFLPQPPSRAAPVTRTTRAQAINNRFLFFKVHSLPFLL
jgi:hypothetical protein